MTPYALLAIIAAGSVIDTLLNIRYWLLDRRDREKYDTEE